MKLQTNIPIKLEKNQIKYDSKLLLLGSCFVENIGEKFNYYKFQSLSNPFGILFHPKAIEKLILKAVNSEKFSEKDVFFLNERWHCFDVHSDLSNSSKEELLINLNNALELTIKQLNKSTHIIITLGTAWVYRLLETNNFVSNCHKVAQKQFSKELLSVEEINNSLESIISGIRKVNKEASIIFTVSPVRHLKDGFVENQLSKSHLITAIHKIVTSSAVEIYYFPSYELMMDELRDYRFYSEDLIHPNQTAINYIWERFKMTWIDENIFSTMEEVETIQKGLSHKPFNPNSEQHQRFLETLSKKISYLQKAFPNMQF